VVERGQLGRSEQAPQGLRDINHEGREGHEGSVG
jgi:hypothetical protein